MLGTYDGDAGGSIVVSALNGLLSVDTLLPVSSAHPIGMFASGLPFGAVFLSVVASTTALVRHNVPTPAWLAGIAAFTVVFAAGQIVGPTLVGWIADGTAGLRGGLAGSAGVLLLGALVARRSAANAARGARRIRRLVTVTARGRLDLRKHRSSRLRQSGRPGGELLSVDVTGRIARVADARSNACARAACDLLPAPSNIVITNCSNSGNSPHTSFLLWTTVSYRNERKHS